MRHRNLLVGWVFIGLSLAGSRAAHAQRAGSDQAGYRDPGTAMMIGVAVPGGGQIYTGETARGLVLLGGSVASLAIGNALSSKDECNLTGAGIVCVEGDNTPLVIGSLVALGFWGYGILDADDSADRQNRRRGIRTGLLERAAPVLIAGSGGAGLGLKLDF